MRKYLPSVVTYLLFYTKYILERLPKVKEIENDNLLKFKDHLLYTQNPDSKFRHFVSL